jgi:DNA transformation protein
MTKLDNPFHTYVEDLFANLGRIRIRKMFGGAGVYSGEDMFALIDKDRVYVKSDDVLKERLQSEGGEPFEWTNPSTGKTIKMSYVSLPVNALDDREEASTWGRQALDVAIQARRAKVKSPRRMTF